jgi:DNA-binding MarR family transcriptional regulator
MMDEELPDKEVAVSNSRSALGDPVVERGLKAFLRLVSMTEPLAMQFWQSHELTLMQVRCLRALRAGPLPAGDLARRLGLSPASTTRLLERLETRGLVRRFSKEDDRRRIWIEATEQGTALTGTLQFWLNTPARTALESLPDQERASVAEALETLADRLADVMNQVEAESPTV